MQPRELLGVAQVPGGVELRLFRRGDDFMIVLDRNELMTTRMHGSEDALATMSLARLKGVKAPHLLVGGYGMGFTLRAALAGMGAEGRVTVAELVPEIIEWARGPMSAVAAGCLDDRRVRLIEGDVADVIETARGAYDAILLDVDNGPDGLVREGNDRLYKPRGLDVALRALRPGGVLAIWSAGSDPAFFNRLRRTGWPVDEVVVRARDDGSAKGKGPRHIIWFVTKRG